MGLLFSRLGVGAGRLLSLDRKPAECPFELLPLGVEFAQTPPDELTSLVNRVSGDAGHVLATL